MKYTLPKFCKDKFEKEVLPNLDKKENTKEDIDIFDFSSAITCESDEKIESDQRQIEEMEEKSSEELELEASVWECAVDNFKK